MDTGLTLTDTLCALADMALSLADGSLALPDMALSLADGSLALPDMILTLAGGLPALLRRPLDPDDVCSGLRVPATWKKKLRL